MTESTLSPRNSSRSLWVVGTLDSLAKLVWVIAMRSSAGFLK